MENNKLSNNKLKKIDKKLKKLQRIVYSEVGVECSIDNISKILVISNAGLTTGLTEEVVYNNFSKYGSLENIVLIPGKSCSFIEYKELNAALQAYEMCNGLLTIAQDSKPIYLLYADKLPNFNLNKTWNQNIPGLIIIENFITPEEEEILLKLCDFQTNINNQMKHRQVKHFGYEFRYDINNVDKDKPLKEKIPKECNFWDRLKDTEFKSFCPNQLTVNHYLPGQGIPHHIDTHSAFEDPIISLSLQSAIVMEFKKDDKHISVLLPQRSLAIMSKECRYDWSHGITPRKIDILSTKNGFTSFERSTRVSFTFRKILEGECNCSFKSKCDSYKKQIDNVQIKNNDASKLENEHVHKVYETIAGHFDDTRQKPWPNVVDFLNSFETGSILVDVGCGNGKYLQINQSTYNLGCDTSSKLLNICNKKGSETFLTNCLNLPFKNNSIDGAISIAVIHHLANEERRFQAIKEISRILKVGGRGLIYVWAKDQLKDEQKTTYIKQDRKNRKKDTVVSDKDESLCVVNNIKLPIHVNRTQFKHEDLLVPWKLKGENTNTFLRFYHVFNENELESLCGRIECIEVVKSFYDQGNWCVIFKKIYNYIP